MPLADPAVPDGSDAFPHLWRHFLSHAPVRHWLMRAPPFHQAALTPGRIDEGIAFCCNFAVPAAWSHMATSFNIGEIFVPHHAERRFMCGTVVAPTPLHKHLVCALGGKASRSPAARATYSTVTRRMVVDMADPSAINIIEFSWMQDANLIVTVKTLVPPQPGSPDAYAGCTGAFAIFSNVSPGGPLPRVPAALVSFIEAPRCELCVSRGAYSCLCAPPVSAFFSASLSLTPPPPTDVVASPAHSFQNVSIRLRRIRRMADVKITMHAVLPLPPQHAAALDPIMPVYRLGGHRFDVKLVDFHPASPGQTHQLRQVADAPRLLLVPADATTMLTATTTTTTTTTSAPARDDSLSAVSSEDALTLSTEPDELYPPVPVSDLDLLDPVGTFPHNGHLLVPAELQLLPSFPPAMARATQCATSPRLPDDRLAGMHEARAAARLAAAAAASAATGSMRGSASAQPNSVTSPLEKRYARRRRTPPQLRVHALRCPHCAMTFSQKGSLNRHVKNVHEASKIPCEYCPLAFGQMSDLQRHQQRKHRGRVVVTERRARVDTKVVRMTVANATAVALRGAT